MNMETILIKDANRLYEEIEKIFTKENIDFSKALNTLEVSFRSLIINFQYKSSDILEKDLLIIFQTSAISSKSGKFTISEIEKESNFLLEITQKYIEKYNDISELLKFLEYFIMIVKIKEVGLK